jgi:hypothetical protein
MMISKMSRKKMPERIKQESRQLAAKNKKGIKKRALLLRIFLHNHVHFLNATGKNIFKRKKKKQWG